MPAMNQNSVPVTVVVLVSFELMHLAKVTQ